MGGAANGRGGEAIRLDNGTTGHGKSFELKAVRVCGKCWDA